MFDRDVAGLDAGAALAAAAELRAIVRPRHARGQEGWVQSAGGAGTTVAKRPGVVPRWRLKWRDRCAWSYKPTAGATSAAGWPASSSPRARSTRRAVR